ncbi:hypothetical protein EWZ98_06470 [Helicobacter pylori]|nr:hypothetical protein [Helicobacter pylori]NHA74498.1 hypothetical protein [Helicobacter pylori]NHA74585.1 hypothetical protein [Helicobacter pylori]
MGIGKKKKIKPPKKEFKRKSLKNKGFKQTPQKKRVKKGSFTKGFNALISEHVIQIHAIESAVFEFSPHEGIVIGVNGGDFHA